jgi:hypothetical protein
MAMLVITRGYRSFWVAIKQSKTFDQMASSRTFSNPDHITHGLLLLSLLEKQF